jgi:HSP20 family protein
MVRDLYVDHWLSSGKERNMGDARNTTREQSSRSLEPLGDARRGTTAMASGEQRRELQRRDRLSSPFEMMRRMTEEMDRAFDRTFSNWGLAARPGSHAWSGSAAQAIWSPRIEAFEKDDTFVVRAELPGLRKEDVEVNVTDDAVVIEGQRRDEREQHEKGFYHTERSYGSFYRAIPLPEGAIGDRAEASFQNGVLEVRVPSPPAEVRRGRRVEIKDQASPGSQTGSTQSSRESRQP